jgi:hypothetical protein
VAAIAASAASGHLALVEQGRNPELQVFAANSSSTTRTGSFHVPAEIGVTCLAVSPCGSLVAVCTEGAACHISIWHLETVSILGDLPTMAATAAGVAALEYLAADMLQHCSSPCRRAACRYPAARSAQPCARPLGYNTLAAGITHHQEAFCYKQGFPILFCRGLSSLPSCPGLSCPVSLHVQKSHPMFVTSPHCRPHSWLSSSCPA